MSPQELKNSILQLAIQGKLVEQRPEEGTAEGLYRQIQAENIETDKAYPNIPDDELPFDIPYSWMFVHIKDIAVLYNGRAYKQNELLNQGKYPVLRVGNLFTNNSWYYSNLELESEKYCDKGDLLYSWSASFGPHIWTGDRVIYHYHIWKIDFSKYVYKKYLYYFLLADTDRIKRSGHGLAMIHVTKASTEERLFPLPPLAEQERIVARIEELLPLIDRYEKAWSRLEDFNKRFPADMQKSLLQLAIQGKLVEQRPEEGTGEELYRQIQKEKQTLIKAGKIKKEKPLPEITEDEIPFDIPESWHWTRIGCVFNTSTGKTPLSSKSAYYKDGKYNWVRTTDLNNGILKHCEIKVSEKAFYECQLEIIPRESVCIAMYGGAGTIGKNALIEFDTTINQSVCAIHPNGFSDMKFLLYYMQFQRPKWMEHATGTRKDPNINKMIIKNAVFPLPPLAEQKRIVAKLEELLPLCEKLK